MTDEKTLEQFEKVIRELARLTECVAYVEHDYRRNCLIVTIRP